MSLVTGSIEWRKIEGWENYSVSCAGDVRNDGTGKVLAASPNNQGYRCVQFGPRGGAKTLKVHRLVAKAFLGPDCGCPEVNHLNGDKGDNRVFNLEWATRSRNMQHAHDNLPRKAHARGDHHKLTRVPDSVVSRVRERVAAGDIQRDIAEELGVSRSWVCRVAKGEKRG